MLYTHTCAIMSEIVQLKHNCMIIMNAFVQFFFSK